MVCAWAAEVPVCTGGFRFALRGATSGQKGGGLGCFGGVFGTKWLPGKQDVVNISGNPLNLARFEGNLGTNGTSWHQRHQLAPTAHRAHIYTDRPNLNPNPNLCVPQS